MFFDTLNNQTNYLNLYKRNIMDRVYSFNQLLTQAEKDFNSSFIDFKILSKTPIDQSNYLTSTFYLKPRFNYNKLNLKSNIDQDSVSIVNNMFKIDNLNNLKPYYRIDLLCTI